jgi:hypothetical protein
MKVNAVSAVAGGCYQNATMETKPDANTEGFNWVNVKSKLKLEGFAIGVAGWSVCSGNVSCRFSPTPADYKDVGDIFLLAPLLWAGFVSKDLVQDDTFPYSPGRTILFYSYMNSQSLVISETHVESDLTDIDITLTTQ